MDTLKLTTADFENGRYKAEKLEYDGHVEIAENLDTVWFASINVTGRLIARAGSGIEAGSAPMSAISTTGIPNLTDCSAICMTSACRSGRI